MKRFWIALASILLAQGCASVDKQATKLSVSPKGAQVEVLLGGKPTRLITSPATPPAVNDAVRVARIELIKEVVKVVGQVGIELIKAQAQAPKH